MILVFDVGGTSLRVGGYCEVQCKLISQSRINTPNFETSLLRDIDLVQQVFKAMKKESDKLALAYDSVVVALPGPITANGYVTALPTILGAPLAHPLPVRALLREQFKTQKLHVLNDIAAAGYRYLTREHHTFHIVSAGSGIGSKLFVNGKPLLGLKGGAGEIGHLVHPLCPRELTCDCGAHGHIGAISSGRGTLRLFQMRAKEQPAAYINSQLGLATPAADSLDTSAIVDAFQGGDQWTLDIMDEALRPLAHCMAATRVVTGVASYILLGGFSCALGEPYRERLASLCASYFDAADWNDSIVLGHADDNNGLIGCALFAKEILHHEHESRKI
jgi:glucokinase